MSLIHEVLAILDEGYRQYNGHISESACIELKCHHKEKMQWFVKDGSKSRKFLCLGCDSRPCILRNPKGFEHTAPPPVHTAKISFMEARAVSAEELFKHKKWFRADEAATLLNVSRSQIYNMAAEGILVRHLDKPFRVTSESLKAEYDKEDW